MSSTPYIEIDWSSTPQQPYPQLGDFTPPENNSAEILYNTEQPTVFSAKDILSLDIDDIYPYTFSTSHREDNETETYPDDEDYFQELLKANLNAEIEVISVLKNNIPPVYNTPLTPIQDNTPLPPLATAPLSENLRTTGKKTTLLVSLKKFHVTTPKRTGYNKIYEIRRSRTFLFELADRDSNTNEIHLKIHTNDYHMKTKPISYNNTSLFPNDKYQISCMLTHFFASQKVIPRRIQDKYFNFLRNKLLDRIKIIKSRASGTKNRNYSTKTFFNFTYKKRRFYLGIYIPCPHLNDPTHFHKDTQCGIPTPFIMSQHRSACVNHQQVFSKTQCFKDIKTKDNLKLEQTSTDFINNKSSHANLLYYRCLNGKLKRITSRRLGISYDSNIHARDPSTKLKVNNRHMYRKRLSNFQYNLSPNIRTQKHQDIRFKRTCRRIFNKMHLPSNRKATNQDYLAIARKYRFLFLKSQYVNTPIRHLLYKHSDSIPTANDYPFLVPYFAMDSNHKKQIMTRLTNASTSTGPSAPPDNYNPIPDIYIPEKYHDIIPKDPIYVNDRYIVPGSREWFTYMYNVDESYYPAESKTPKYDRKGKYIPRNPIYRSGVVENFVPSHIVTKAQRARPKKLKTVISLTEAAYHGTTPKHYPTRINEIESLTEATDSFHNRIPHYLAKRAENHRIGSSTTSMDKSLTKFLRNNNLRSQGTMQFLRYRYTDVSDETAEVEYRPNKRDDIHNENHYFSFQDHTTKRLRPTPATNNDSLVPGPSCSKTI
ncbi:hypothetical protein RhiirC2_783479 [Rhizophagus irregularis]|uniref:DUF8211 domain-containing protein n=1 Tax=Rhizophagus irregularis TaxID=588596 RepID=A0A2N1N0P7_9GLOM|nr:hypothetical protein RhiirC2_783479 [Rhizophagus irregularis]